MYLPFECDFCVLNFAVRSDRNTHLMRHFKQRCCTNCDKSLLQIGDNWYELRLHFDKNCNIVDEDRSSAYGQKVFKTEDSTAYPNEEWLTPIQEFKEFSENRFTTQTNDTVIDVKSEIPEYDVLNVDTLLPEASDKIATKSDEFGNDDARHSNQSQQYECETCQKRFNYISSLRRHLRKGHDKADRFKCEICKKGFCDQNELKIHARNMHDGQRYTCEFCNRNFKKKYRLNVHKTVHTTEHQVTCDICQKQFRHKAFLVKHMRIHVDKKKFSCEICSKEFASVKIAKSHKRIVHEKKAVHKCNVCDKVSATSTNLKVHMNSHLDNRPFVCNYCGKSFKQKVHMMEHINGHTGGLYIFF